MICPYLHPNQFSLPVLLPNPADLLVCKKAPAPWPFGCPVPMAPQPAHWPISSRAPSAGSCPQKEPGFPAPPAQLVYRAKGGGKGGDWHAVPSMDRPTSAWLAFLPEQAKESLIVPLGRGGWERGERGTRCQRVSRADARAGLKLGDIPEWRTVKKVASDRPALGCVIPSKSLSLSGLVSSSVR